MALGVSGSESLPPFVLDKILDKTDGVPLFVEELVKSVLEEGVSPSGPGGADDDWAGPARTTAGDLEDHEASSIDPDTREAESGEMQEGILYLSFFFKY